MPNNTKCGNKFRERKRQICCKREDVAWHVCSLRDGHTTWHTCTNKTKTKKTNIQSSRERTVTNRSKVDKDSVSELFFFFLGAKGKEQNQEWGLQKKTSVINDTAEQKRGMRERMIIRAMQYWEPFCPNRSLYFIMFHLNTNHNSKKGQKKINMMNVLSWFTWGQENKNYSERFVQFFFK